MWFVGLEDLSTGILLPESADGGDWFDMGTSVAYSANTDSLCFHLPVAVQHSAGVPFLGRRKQRRQRRYGHVGVNNGARMCV